jgi:ERCC4-type nuclease
MFSSALQFHRPSRDADEEYEGKAWLKTSRSFDQLNTISSKQEIETVAKKSRTTKLISRIFKRKSVTPASQKRAKVKPTKHSNNRESVVSNVSNVSAQSRERCLTASMSMPDISSELSCTCINIGAVVLTSVSMSPRNCIV